MNKHKKSEPVSRSELVTTLTVANARIAQLERALAPVASALHALAPINTDVEVPLTAVVAEAILAAGKL
jgi:hypothetical protein